MLFDDDVCARNSIEAFLVTCGIRCVSVSTGDAAMAQCKDGTFDVAILQLGSTYGGRQVCAELKKVRPTTKVLGMSVSHDERVTGNLKSTWGFDAVLSKPCDMDELSDVLHTIFV